MSASIALLIFIGLLFFGGVSNAGEIAISVGAFVVSWVIMSYFVKRYGVGSLSKNDFEKEFQWYVILLILFLVIITFIGVYDAEIDLTFSLYVILIFGFSFIWIIRSLAIKYFN